MGIARPRKGVWLKSGTDLLKLKDVDMYDESAEHFKQRKDFEKSHSFQVGDKVLVVDYIENVKAVRNFTYLGSIGEVYRVETSAATGACIQVAFWGTRLNFWHPSRELVKVGRMVNLLYGK